MGQVFQKNILRDSFVKAITDERFFAKSDELFVATSRIATKRSSLKAWPKFIYWAEQYGLRTRYYLKGPFL